MIFFDLDGTILDQGQAEKQAAVALWGAEQIFKRLDQTQFVAGWSEVTEHYFNQHLRGELTFQEQRRCRVRAMAERCQVQLSDAEADRIFQQYLRVYEDSWSLFDDASALLAELRRVGRRMGVITNGEGSQQRHKLKRSGIAAMFEPVVISGEHQVAKPKREIFEIACALAAVTPAECWYVGDRLDVDAEGSRNAGLKAVWINRSAVPQNSKSEVVLEVQSLMDPVLLAALGVG